MAIQKYRKYKYIGQDDTLRELDKVCRITAAGNTR